jgi:hypothetical protein
MKLSMMDTRCHANICSSGSYTNLCSSINILDLLELTGAKTISNEGVGINGDQTKVTSKFRLSGKLDAVTRMSLPSSTSSETFFWRLGRVASSS